jgi:PAS domain S-box-containing protein
LQALDGLCDAPSEGLRVRKRLPSAPLLDAEIPLSYDEIFFSRTNTNGHIVYGNATFQRTSLYSWEELEGQPHSIVRHPDMPRGLFWILWNALKKGQPIGAYMKNKAKDGRYYWVFAVVTPIDDGYLSVRIKPSSDLSPIMAQEYATLADAEREQDLKPAASAQLLLSRLSELGFSDYSAFMAAALSQEIKLRDKQLARSTVASQAQFGELTAAAEQLLEKVNSVSANYAIHRNIPLYLKMCAEKDGEKGAAIAIVSENYNTLSTSMNASMPGFLAASRRLVATVNESTFLFCTAVLQREVRVNFDAERSTNQLGFTGEPVILDLQCSSYRSKAASILRSVASEAHLLERICADLVKAGAGLETSLLLGKRGNLRVACERAGLSAFIDNLEPRYGAMMEGLRDIISINQTLERSALYLLPRIKAA